MKLDWNVIGNMALGSAFGAVITLLVVTPMVAKYRTSQAGS